EADRVVLAPDLGVPQAGPDHFELAVDVDVLELVDQDHRGIAIDRDVARRYFDFEPLVRPVTELFHDGSGVRAVLVHVGAVTGDRAQNFLRHAPDPGRRRQHRAADIRFALVQDIHEGLAV